jgi:acyl-coenzyme A thioesterase PaaI-like protein
MAGPSDGGEQYTSASRLAAAAALRRLGDAFVSHQTDDTVLGQVAEEATRFAELIRTGPDRVHGFFQPDRPELDGSRRAPIDGAPLAALADCVISGQANPMGVAATFFQEGEEAICRVEIGEAFEGAPDRVHGGIVSAIFDHTMGLATAATPAFTGWIKVTYRAPTPLNTPLEIRARVTERDGRKLTVTAEMQIDGATIVEGEGLFITFDLEKVLGAASDAGSR